MSRELVNGCTSTLNWRTQTCPRSQSTIYHKIPFSELFLWRYTTQIHLNPSKVYLILVISIISLQRLDITFVFHLQSVFIRILILNSQFWNFAFCPYLEHFKPSWQNEKALSFQLYNWKRPGLNGKMNPPSTSTILALTYSLS